jgi:hypothetical protein
VTPPPATRRLFAPGAELDSARYHAWLIERLLEDGDTHDLRWLFQTVPRKTVADWLQHYGGRRLSRRSRSLWCAVLGVQNAPTSEIARALWPL